MVFLMSRLSISSNRRILRTR
uniref:Uncharacterized protein n=1 Tax=Arundo donax TaxID=35708 RepID=A0A0A9GY58_ARUDO